MPLDICEFQRIILISLENVEISQGEHNKAATSLFWEASAEYTGPRISDRDRLRWRPVIQSAQLTHTPTSYPVFYDPMFEVFLITIFDFFPWRMNNM